MRTLFGVLFLSLAAFAQGEPDISIDAKVRARSVRFEQVPNVRVTFPGQGRRDTRWTGERRNLPTPVRPGVTYKNVEASTSIRSQFRDWLETSKPEAPQRD